MKKLTFFFLFAFAAMVANANYMLVQNVSTTGNNAGAKTIQLQFDLSWENSWRDDINWDAAWLFVKYKDAGGVWHHAKLNTTGFVNGSGTASTVQVTSDNVGAYMYRSAKDTGNFNVTGAQLQWNYGADGLTDVTGLEVRVFAVEMVYIPQGDFTVMPGVAGVMNFEGYYTDQSSYFIHAPGNNYAVINNRLSPTLTATDDTIRIKGDVGVDFDNDGLIDNANYPTGYKAYYIFKYELTEQQYADFYNTLTATQKATLNLAGETITLSNGDYYASAPNRACGNATLMQLFAYSDWAGLRPMTYFEYSKACLGPYAPFYNEAYNKNDLSDDFGYTSWNSDYGKGDYEYYHDVVLGLSGNENGTESGTCRYGNYYASNFNNGSLLLRSGIFANAYSNRDLAGAGYYGVMDLTGNTKEPIIPINSFSFKDINGNGVLNPTGNSDIVDWNVDMIIYVDANASYLMYSISEKNTNGFRYVRSAE